jgi:uncharacterized protein
MKKLRGQKLNSTSKAEFSVPRASEFSVPRASEFSVPRVRPWRLRFQDWMRWLHIYTSMLSLIVVLFFSITGITLNHPDWLFGTKEIRQEYTGTLPKNWYSSQTVNWLVVVEYLRANHDVKGKAIDMHSSQLEASLRFAAPGYTADGFIEVKTGAYSLNTSSQGFVAAMNDFHRGRNAGGVWAVLIDVAGWFLVLISATGLALLFYLKKIRLKAILTLVLGGGIMVLLMQFLT